MNNKKALYFLIGSLLLVAVVAFFLSWQKIRLGNLLTGDKNSQELTQEKLVNDLDQASGKTACNFKDETVAFRKASESLNMFICDCIKSEGLKGDCQRSVMDLGYYDQALKQFDETICSNISDVSKKEACQSVVKSSVEHLKQADPGYLSSQYISSGKFLWAAVILENELKKDPNNIPNLVTLAIAYANIGLEKHEEKVYGDKALKLLDEAIALKSDDPEIYRAQGYVYEVRNELMQAVGSYNKSIGLDGNYVPAYVGRAHANNLIGDLEKSLEDLKKAATLDTGKKYDSIYSNLCRLESTRGDLLEEGIGNCNIVTKSKTAGAIQKAEAHQILASIYMKMGKNSEADANLKMAQVFQPGSINMLLSYADLNIRQEKYDAAEKNARDAIAIDKTRTNAYDALAYALYKQEKYDEAIQKALIGLSLVDKDVTILQPDKPEVKKNLNYILANIYSAKGDKANETKYKELGDAAVKPLK